MDNLDRYIRERLHVKRGDCLPFTGWSGAFTRNNLAELFNEAGFKYGAEIGVRKGFYSRTLCDTIPGLRLLCVDPWAPFEGGRPSQERQDAYFERTKKLLSGFDVQLIRKTSMEAVEDVKDGELDFVYIDALHYFDYVMMDIIRWTPKVRIGGIVSGHDYFDNPRCGVVDAVRAYTFAHAIHSWFLTREPPTQPEPFPSWFWVRS